MGSGEQSKRKLNIDGIKILDPYALHIVDGSDHVSVHSFNDEKDQWDKKVVEAALFVYRRSRRPYNFLLIDYFFDKEEIEQITAQKRVKIDSPLLFYKNEKNGTRCFRFKTTDECVRIGTLVEQLVKSHSEEMKQQPVGILSMLAKAQEMVDQAVSGFTDSRAVQPIQNPKIIPPNTTSTSPSVMNFFAAANPSARSRRRNPNFKRVLSEPIHVDQIEKQQRFSLPATHLTNPSISMKRSRSEIQLPENATTKPKSKLLSPTSFSLAKDSVESLSFDVAKINVTEGHVSKNVSEPLTHNQLLQAMTYLIKNDEGFLTQLHGAYLQSFKEMLQK